MGGITGELEAGGGIPSKGGSGLGLRRDGWGDSLGAVGMGYLWLFLGESFRAAKVIE